MNAQDIRIGNLFSQKGFPMYVEAIFRDTVYLNFEGNEGDVWEEDIKDLVPIPLTEEILLKAGFEKEENPYLDNFNNDILSLSIYKGKVYYSLKSKTFIEIESNYLHQLQNLFFALTGEEIKIEL